MEQPPEHIAANQSQKPDHIAEAPPAAGYPTPQSPPQNQPVFVQPQQGYGQPQSGMVAQPGVAFKAAPASTPTVIPSIGLPSIALRSFITGVGLLLVGFAYFVLGCICRMSPDLAAEGIIIGLLNMASGVAGIMMKFKLLKLETVDSLINYTWVFICFGAISLATAFGAFRFVLGRAIIAGSYYNSLARDYGYDAANFALGTAASATIFVFIILVFSILMLTCSGSIRNRLKEALSSGAIIH
ncbi:uncharacterized protein LOC135495871 [Lineus longissimus]|uniref:uncharacterized protein LOC135495871 n=1 Tax=Lineus longissimus TaxID=88925 RepID=UPI002B4EFE88